MEMSELPTNYLPQEGANITVPSTSERDPIVLGHQHLVGSNSICLNGTKTAVSDSQRNSSV